MLESLEGYAQQVVDFVRLHQVWAAPIAFALAFGESLAFISLVIPAWAALVGIGVLIGSSNLRLWPIFIAASLGAAFGDVGSRTGPASSSARRLHVCGRCRGILTCYPGARRSCASGACLPFSSVASSDLCVLRYPWWPAYSACPIGRSSWQTSLRRFFGRLCCSPWVISLLRLSGGCGPSVVNFKFSPDLQGCAVLECTGVHPFAKTIRSPHTPPHKGGGSGPRPWRGFGSVSTRAGSAPSLCYFAMLPCNLRSTTCGALLTVVDVSGSRWKKDVARGSRMQ